MADKYVASTGSNTSPYDTWAKAATDPTTAINAAAAGEKVYVHAGTYTASATQTWVMAGTAASPVVIICSNDTINAPPQTLGAGWTYDLGATGYDLAINGVGEIHRMTVSPSGGSGVSSFTVGSTDDDYVVLRDCAYNSSANTASGSTSIFGGTANINAEVVLNNFAYVGPNATGGGIQVNIPVEWVGGSATSSNAGSDLFSSVSTGQSMLNMNGVDLSGWTGGDLFNPSTGRNFIATLENCKLNSGANPVAAFTNVSQGEFTFINCSSDDTHYKFAYYDYLGTMLVDVATYANDGAEYNAAGSKFSWKITTTANASLATPFQSPWIRKYNEATSAISPYLEGLKGSDTDSSAATTAQNDEVWAVFSVQATASSTKGTVDFSDRVAYLAAAADQTSAKATTDWTISTGNDLYKSTFKLLGTAQTPAVIGPIMARVCVGIPEKTFFIDPQIRT